MEFASFDVSAPDMLLATAVHDGHEMRPELAELSALDETTRLREEDPNTGSLARRFANNVVAHRSRFEVDLNRDREGAVYRGPDEAWGLEIWRRPLTRAEIEESLLLYDGFYAGLTSALDRLVADQGGFVLYDIHSYNHRREGRSAPPEPAEATPEINLGTGSLPERWKRVADVFIESMRANIGDVRENVRFKGGHLARWVHENYGENGCALAIELKKVFMDEWTAEVDSDRLEQLGAALVHTADPVRHAWKAS